MANKELRVTQPFLPPLSEFQRVLEEIWESKWLTNCGPFHQRLEEELCRFLGVRYLSLFSNGTIALVTALQALKISGEVITTPYSFVATAHSLLWNGLCPVFVDIDPATMSITPELIENAITDRTTAILPVHCYGLPANVAEIDRIARNRGIKVIYDAAHAFGVARKCDGRSILHSGDLSVLSFHATKVFNTFEGGAIVCADAEMKARIDHLKNFGFVDEVTVIEAGINGKMSEVNAGFGLVQLRHVSDAIEVRRRVDERYRESLTGIPGLRCISLSSEWSSNYSYFPVLVETPFPLSRDELFQRLRSENIFSRRYFYPLISDFPMYRDLPSAARSSLPVAASIADRVICLPIHSELTLSDVDRVVAVIAKAAS